MSEAWIRMIFPPRRLRTDGLPLDAPGSNGRDTLIPSPLLRLLVFGAMPLVTVGICAVLAALFFPISRVVSATDPVGITVTLVGVGGAYGVLVLLERRRPFELALKRIFGLLVGAVAGFRLLEESQGTWIATVLSGVVFGLLHITTPGATLWGAIAIVVEGGLLLALLYALTRSLWIVIGYHAAWNTVQGPVLGVPVSGNLSGPSLLTTTMTGPDWLTGGAFGAEGSMVPVIVLTLANVVLGVLLVRRRGVVAPRWGSHRAAAVGIDSGPSLG